MRRDGRIRVMPIQRNQTTVGGRIGCAVVSVLVADAHDLAWIGLVMILDAQSAIQVIGEARDGHDAVRHAALRPADFKDAGPELLVQTCTRSPRDALIAPSVTARLLRTFACAAAPPNHRIPKHSF